MFSVITQHSTQIISLITIATLARLLTPEEIGVYAVAASIAFLAIELRALGVGQYLIRETQICDAKIRSATGLIIVTSWSLAVIIAATAPFISDFYNEEALTTLFWIISSTFIFAPFSSIPHALLTRELKFQTLLKIRITTSIVRSVSSIGFVVLGYSYYGLALGVLAGAIAEVALFSFYRPAKTPWLPSFAKFNELFRFGIYTSTANMMQQFSLSIPDIVLGRVATMTDVGLFSRGLGVVIFINNILSKAVAPVVLPHLSKVKRGGGSVGDAYLRAITLQGAFCWPLFAVVNLCAFSMIRALFGDQWDAAVPIASVLAIWAILQSTHSFSSLALLAVEKENLIFKKEIIIFAARLASVLIAAPYGMVVIAWAMVLAGVVELIVNTWVMRNATGIGVRQLAVALLPNALITVACWSSLKLLDFFIDFKTLNPWLSLVVIGVCMLATWLVALRLTKHETWELAAQMARQIFQNKSQT